MEYLSPIEGSGSATISDSDPRSAATKGDVDLAQLIAKADNENLQDATKAEITALRAEIASVRASIDLSASEGRTYVIRSLTDTERWLGTWLLALKMLGGIAFLALLLIITRR